jgi:hypothetical protein
VRGELLNECDTGLCLPPDATAEDVTEIIYNAGEVEGLEERIFDLACIDAERPNESDRTESYGLVKWAKNSWTSFPRTPILTSVIIKSRRRTNSMLP